MTSATADSTLGDLVTACPGRSRVFETMGLDYCCKGGQSLEQACQVAHQDLHEVLEKLAAFDASAAEQDEPDYDSMSLGTLADHLVATHHAYLKEEMPQLAQLVDKVFRVHGRKFPWLEKVRQVSYAMFMELDGHLQKEEMVLFPMIHQLEEATSAPNFHCGGIDGPISVMLMEHDSAGEALVQLRELTSDYTVPADGCNSFRAMMDRLKTMEYDLHRHIHKENSVLFPKAQALAEKF